MIIFTKSINSVHEYAGLDVMIYDKQSRNLKIFSAHILAFDGNMNDFSEEEIRMECIRRSIRTLKISPALLDRDTFYKDLMFVKDSPVSIEKGESKIARRFLRVAMVIE